MVAPPVLAARIPRLSRRCVIDSYSKLSPDSCRIDWGRVPQLRDPKQLLVKVAASSINPIDLRMGEGYGAEILNSVRCSQSVLNGHHQPEFPLVVGRDFSGEVVDMGPAVQGFKIGDEVFGATFPASCGTHQEFITVDIDSVTPKPATVPHSVAAAVPYAGLTAAAALYTTGSLQTRADQSRVLILGAGGGVGSVALQLAAASGCEVTAVAGPQVGPALHSLEAAHVLNYRSGDYTGSLIALSGFDVILDCCGLGSKSSDLVPLLRNGGRIVTLDSPLLRNTDKQGLLMGGLSSITQLVTQNIQSLETGNTVRWAYFSPNIQALKNLSSMLENKRLSPVIDKSFVFDNIPEAYQYFAAGKHHGKVVITF